MSYVDEKIAKITLDNKAFTKNAEDTIKSLERLKQAFNKAGDIKAAKQVQKEMDSLSQNVGKSVQKSESMLSKLSGIFRKSTSNIDMSGASKSVDKMNADIANKTARTSDILSRLKGIFQKADTTDGFSNSISAVDKLNAKITTINASPIGQAFQSVAVQVQNSISIMDIALGNFIGNAMTKIAGFSKQFMAGPMDGYAEYVNKMTSIQTIKSNTESAFGGDTNRQMIQINRTLSDLNEYADQTIYSFEDMTRNIGTFTAAGVGLEDSATAIKGISNLAAASGSSTMQASTAMYQLSQALASGRVSLMDWNSVVNAGMGGELFKNALYDTADAIGIARDKTKSFRDSLQDGWLTSEVLLETLKKFSTNESMLDAATKVKTFSQLIDTTKEAIGSGWSETWEYVFGGLEEAKGLWSDVAKSIGGYLDDNQGKFFDTTLQMERNLGNFRNAMLKTWKDEGGQKAFFEGIKSSVQGLMSVMSNFRQGWRDVMGDYKTQAAALVDVTNKFLDMSNAFRDNVKLQEATKNFGGIFAGLTKGAGSLGQAFTTAFSMAQNGGKSLTETLLTLSNSLLKIGQNFVNSGGFSKLVSIFADIGSAIGHAFGFINSAFQNIISGFVSVKSEGTGALDAIKNITQAIQDFFIKLNSSSAAMDVMRNIGVTLGNVWSIFKSVLTIVIQLISSFIPESISMGTSIKDVSDAVAEITGGMRKWFEELANSKDKFDIIKNGVRTVSDAISDLFDGTKKFNAVSIFDGISKGLKGIGEFFKPVIDGFKTFLSLLTPANVLAGGFAMVAWKIIGMIKKLGKNFDDLKEHFTGFESIKELIFGKKDEDSFGWMDGLKQGLDNLTSFTNLATLISIAVSIGILAKALDTLSGLETKDIVEGMSAIGVAMHALQVNMNKLNDLKINPRVATTLVAFAFALKLIAGAIKTLAGLKPMEVVQGTVAIITVMYALSKAMQSLDKLKFSPKAAGILLAFGISLRIIASAITSIGSMNLQDVAEGTSSIIAVMFSLAASMKMISGIKFSPKAAGILLAFGISLRIIASAITSIGSMNLQDVAEGTSSIIAVMFSLAASMKMISGIKFSPKAAGILLAFGISLRIIASAITSIGSMNLQDVAEGTIAIGLALAGLVVAAKMISSIKVNMGTSVALLAIAGAIRIMATSISIMGSMNTGDLIQGLLSMGAALTALVVAAAALSAIGPGALVGSGALLVIAAALTLLMVPLTAFASMSLGQVATSLIMLGGALAIVIVAGGAAGAVAPGLLVLSAALLGLGVAAAGIGIALAGAGYFLQSIGALLKDLASTSSEQINTIVNNIVEFAVKIGAAAPILMTSFVNLISAMLDGIVILVPKLVDTGFKLIIGLVRGLRENLPVLVTEAVHLITEFAQSIADNASHLVDAAFKIVTTLVEGIASVFPNYAPRLTEAIISVLRVAFDMLLTIVSELVMPLVQGIVDAFRPLIQLILDIFTELSAALAPIINPIADVIIAVIDGIVAVVQTVGNVIITTIQAISQVIQTIGQTIQSVFQSFASVVQSIAFAIVGALNAVAGIITSVFNGIASVISAVGSAIQSILIGLGQAFIGFGVGVNAVLQGVATVFESIGSSIKSVLEGVGSVVESIGESIKTALEGVGQIFKDIGESIHEVCTGITEVVEGIGESIERVLNAVANIFESLGNAAEKAGRGFKMVGEGVSEILQYSLGELVTNLGAVADAMIKMTTHSEQVSSVGTAMGDIGTGLMIIAKSGDLAMVSITMLNTTLPMISSSLGTIPQQLTQAGIAFSQFGTSVSSGIMLAVPTAISGINVLMSSIRNAMTSGSSQGLIMGQQLASQIGIGIMAGSGVVRSSAMTLASQAIITIQATFSKGSPAGQQFGAQVAIGILSSSGIVRSAGTQLSTAAASGLLTTINKASQMGQLFGQNVTRGMLSQSGSVMNAGKVIAQGAVTAITATFATAVVVGMRFGQGIASGINATAGSARAASHHVAASAASGISGYYGSFYSSGVYLASGLAAGISAGSSGVMWAAISTASRAAAAIRATLDIHSPSRVTYAFGEFFSEGFINGIVSLVGQAVKTSTTLAEKTVDAVSDTADAIESTFDRTLDFNPTITPVVDMSNMDKLNRAYKSEWQIGTNVPSNINPNAYRNQNGVTNSTTNHTNEYQYDINVNVSGSQASNPREIAKAVQTEIKRMNDRAKVGRGEQPIW